MSKLIQVTLVDFVNLFEYAQNAHLDKGEPIPDMSPYNLERVETCLITPFQVVFGTIAYKGFCKKAAVLFYLMIKNHALENGNKRMAVIVLVYFCYLNKRIIALDDESFEKIAIIVANSDAMFKDVVIRVTTKLFKVCIKKADDI